MPDIEALPRQTSFSASDLLPFIRTAHPLAFSYCSCTLPFDTPSIILDTSSCCRYLIDHSTTSLHYWDKYPTKMFLHISTLTLHIYIFKRKQSLTIYSDRRSAATQGSRNTLANPNITNRPYSRLLFMAPL